MTSAGDALDDFEAAMRLAPRPPIYGSPFANLTIFACFALIIPPLIAGAWLVAVLTHGVGYGLWLKHVHPRLDRRPVRVAAAVVLLATGYLLSAALAVAAGVIGGLWGIVAAEALLAFLTLAASGPNGRSRLMFAARFAPVGVALLVLPFVALTHGAPLGSAAALAGGNALLTAMIIVVSRRRSANLARLNDAVKSADAAESLAAGLIAAAPMGFVMTDKDLNILHASPKWLRDEGLEGQAVLGRPLYEVVPIAAAGFADHAAVLRGEQRTEERLRLVRADGTTRWVHIEMAPWRDPQGDVAGMLLMMQDVTAMVESFEDVERSEQRLKLAIQLAGLHVWELDYARNTLEKAGPEADFYDRELTFEDMVPSVLDTIHPDDRDHVYAAWMTRRDRQAGDSPMSEHRTNRSDGKEVWAASIAKLIRNAEGEPVRMLGAMQNITRRKHAEAALLLAKEEAEAANHAKSQFLATMSHEIRTPLNGVLGMAQAMAAGDLDPAQRERLDVIRQSGETLLAILNDVLDLSKIEAGKLELESAPFDLDDVARGAHAAFTALASGKDVMFSLTVEPAARGTYRGDATRVRQVLYNLISNALKFTDQGEVRVTAARDGEELVFTVTDSGIGIAPDRLKELFQNFVQADASTTRRFGGTGLGLSICRQLAEMMGGSVVATSTLGAGSTFTARLGVPKISDDTAAPAAAPEPQDAVEGVTLRVLAAEDNSVNQLVLKTLLSQIGLTPRIVENGAEALAAWEAEPWDVILMDVQMPVMDGPTATHEIRRREAASGRARTPIIALTANAMAHQIVEYRACGMDGFVAKPIEIGRLFEALQTVAAALPNAEQRSA